MLQRIAVLVEYVEIYPPLNGLCGLDRPGHLQGDSTEPLFHRIHPGLGRQPCLPNGQVSRLDPEKTITVSTVKTDRYRYIEWTRIKTAEILACELYDHQNDPPENVSFAGLEGHKALVENLSRLLEHGGDWRQMRPKD